MKGPIIDPNTKQPRIFKTEHIAIDDIQAQEISGLCFELIQRNGGDMGSSMLEIMGKDWTTIQTHYACYRLAEVAMQIQMMASQQTINKLQETIFGMQAMKRRQR